MVKVGRMHSTPYSQYLAPVIAATHRAGEVIMRYYNEGYTASHKQDKSPVTEADLAANELITKELLAIAPHIPIIAEEDTSNHGAPVVTHPLFWLVDPLDGTRAFVAGEPEFTVNIGLIENGIPVLGVIYSPADGTLYYGSADGAFRQKHGGAIESIQVRTKPADGVTVVRSKSQP
jgi:3'(2'), 5'-bisphosphate nucleotidase